MILKTILFVILLGFPYLLLGQGINFEPISFEEALVKAKKENKMILLDAYTTWCGPCKEMAAKVFPQKKAGDYFNGRFISLKIDMEKEKELAKKLNITSYPTFFVFKSDGSVLTRFSGACNVDNFTALVERGVQQKNSYGDMNKKFERGELKGAETVDYIKMLFVGGERDRGIVTANQLLSNLSDEEKISTIYWPLYDDRRMTHLKSETFAYILEHKREFGRVIGKKKINQKIYQVYHSYLMSLTFGNMANPPYEEVKVQEIEKNAVQLRGKLTKVIQAQCAFARARNQNDPDRMLDELAKFVDVLDKNTIWGQTSAFIKVGGLMLVKDKAKLKMVGRKIVDKAEDENKNLYIKYYELNK